MTFKYEIVWSVCKNNIEISQMTQDAVGDDIISAMKYAVKQAENTANILGNEFIRISACEYKIIADNDVYLYNAMYYKVVGLISTFTNITPFYKRWLKKNILKIICSLIIAFVICLMLGFSRPHPAFGGEDLIPLGTLFAWGLAYLDSWEKEKNSHK